MPRSVAAPEGRVGGLLADGRCGWSGPNEHEPPLTTGGTEMERRKGRRYPLRAPAFCWWRHADGETRVTQGTSRDLSHRGAFIFSVSLPSPGAHVEVDVYLPSTGLTPRSVQLHGEGTVLRVSQPGNHQSGLLPKWCSTPKVPMPPSFLIQTRFSNRTRGIVLAGVYPICLGAAGNQRTGSPTTPSWMGKRHRN